MTLDPAQVFDATGRVPRPPARLPARELQAVLLDRPAALSPSEAGGGLPVTLPPSAR